MAPPTPHPPKCNPSWVNRFLHGNNWINKSAGWISNHMQWAIFWHLKDSVVQAEVLEVVSVLSVS